MSMHGCELDRRHGLGAYGSSCRLQTGKVCARVCPCEGETGATCRASSFNHATRTNAKYTPSHAGMTHTLQQATTHTNYSKRVAHEPSKHKWNMFEDALLLHLQLPLLIIGLKPTEDLENGKTVSRRRGQLHRDEEDIVALAARLAQVET